MKQIAQIEQSYMRDDLPDFSSIRSEWDRQ